MGIDNIHAVRESFVKMFELLNKDDVYVLLIITTNKL
jgi:hypothetical protein